MIDPKTFTLKGPPVTPSLKAIFGTDVTGVMLYPGSSDILVSYGHGKDRVQIIYKAQEERQK